MPGRGQIARRFYPPVKPCTPEERPKVLLFWLAIAAVVFGVAFATSPHW